MEGCKGIDVAAMLNVHRQSVSTYVKNFEEGGIQKLPSEKHHRVKFLTYQKKNKIN